MTDERSNHNLECRSDSHGKHLCYFVSYGYHVDNAEDYKSLIDEPKFKCYFCGRPAHNAESLCKPMKL